MPDAPSSSPVVCCASTSTGALTRRASCASVRPARFGALLITTACVTLA